MVVRVLRDNGGSATIGARGEPTAASLATAILMFVCAVMAFGFPVFRMRLSGLFGSGFCMQSCRKWPAGKREQRENDSGYDANSDPTHTTQILAQAQDHAE
jgi:hypothetical protein